MKKIIFYSLALLAIFGLVFNSCKKDTSSEHQYTAEELKELARQDSLKKIIPVDWVFHKDITIPISAGYTGVTVTVDSVKLLELFNYKTVKELAYALGKIESGAQTGNDITFYAYNYSTKYPVNNPSTTNYFGHWFDKNGDVCSWGDQAYLFCEKQDTFSLKFTIGLFPDRPVIDSVYHIVEAMQYATKKVAFLFNVKIGDIYVPSTTVTGTKTMPFNAVWDTNYAATALTVPVSEITSAIGVAPDAATLYGINSDGSLYAKGFTANNGYWFTATGDVCKWGDAGCAIYAEYDATNQIINVGQFPEGTTVGQTYTGRFGFANLTNLKQYTVVMTMTVTAKP